METERIDPLEIRAALDELLASPGIARSQTLGEVLRYVVEKTLAGEESSIKAYAIAVDVLGRPATFDAQSDPIVRVQARRLRAAMQQFYATGGSRAAVRIELPLGRYVPEFVRLGEPHDDLAAAPVVAPSWWPRGNWQALVVAILPTLIGVFLTVALLRWILPPNATSSSPLAPPDYPIISIQPFDVLSPSTGLDGAEIANELSSRLASFDLVRVGPQGADFVLTGSVRKSGQNYAVSARLAAAKSTGVVWSTQYEVPPGSALPDLALRLAGMLGGAGSPLFEAGSAWLRFRPESEASSAFLCAIKGLAWNSTLTAEDAAATEKCSASLMSKNSKDGYVAALHATINAWRAAMEPGVDAALMRQATDEMENALALSPKSSAVRAFNAVLQLHQNNIQSALSSSEEAVTLNPQDFNAVALRGYLLWISGQFDSGVTLSEQAIAGTISPPFWYYAVRVCEGVRTGNYLAATQAALDMTAGDVPQANVIALAAASLADQRDIVERYLKIVLGDKTLRQTGLLTAIAPLMPQRELISRLRDGLVKAGIPPAALDGPFADPQTPTSASNG